MRPYYLDWQRRPRLFGLALATLSILGFVVILADDGVWRDIGSLGAAMPSLLAGLSYMTHLGRNAMIRK